MQNAAQAYARTAQATAHPRELEAQLLLRAAAKLQAVGDGNITEDEEVLAAIRYNRKLWQVLFTSVSDAGNPLPESVKQNLANLAAYVINQSMMLEFGPVPNRIKALISINREIAAGLRGA